MSKKLLAVILAGGMALSMAACGDKADSASSAAADAASAASSAAAETADDGKSVFDSENTYITEDSPLYVAEPTGETYKIMFIIEEMSPFMSQTADGAVMFDEEHDDVEVTVSVGDNDVAKELSIVENAIANDYDAVVMKPYDSAGCAPAVDYCHEAGIPIIAMNNNFAGVEADSFVGSDHKLSGELAAQGMVDVLGGKGKVAILSGAMDQQAAIDRMDGIHEVLEQYPDIEIVDEQDAAWSTDEAQNKVEAWLSSGKEIDGIIACASQMALGAQLALESDGKQPGDIPIASIDAMEMSLNIYKTGWVTSDVLQDAYGQGYMGVAAAYAMLNGIDIDSYIDVPYVPVAPEEVDTYLARYS